MIKIESVYSWVQNDRLLRAVFTFVFGLPLFTSGTMAYPPDIRQVLFLLKSVQSLLTVAWTTDIILLPYYCTLCRQTCNIMVAMWVIWLAKTYIMSSS